MKCGRICRAETCHPHWPRGFYRVGQKFEFLTISSLYVPYISATAKIEAYKQRMKLFDPPCRNTEICPSWKSCLEFEWRVCVSSTDALVIFYITLPSCRLLLICSNTANKLITCYYWVYQVSAGPHPINRRNKRLLLLGKARI